LVAFLLVSDRVFFAVVGLREAIADSPWWGIVVVSFRCPLAKMAVMGFGSTVTDNSEQPTLVQLDGIVKRFGAFAANDQVALHVREGEIHALMGENGAGKSTLVKILFGLLQPDAGLIRWKGQEVRITSPEMARSLGIAMVFQHFSLFDNLSVLENIALGLPGRKVDMVLAEEAQMLATRYQLGLNLSAPVWSLSAGERQRIEIVRALLQKPRLLVLDEPTSVLTPQEAESLFQTLERLVADGASVLFISHKLDEVRRLCRRATILRGGKLVAHADPRVESSRSLAALMVGSDVVEARRGNHGVHGRRQPVLSIKGLAVQSADAHGVTLRDVSLDVCAGEIVAIAGVAGGGQKELFAALSGEDGRVTHGTVWIHGTDITAASISRRRDLGAAFVPEDRLGQATLPRATLAENLIVSLPRGEVSSRGGWLDRSGLMRNLRAILQRFDVRASAENPEARRLSGGNLQKYVIGREILRKPTLLVVNQPTWGVDAAATQRIREALMALADDGAAVLVISQDLDEVFAIADRIAVIRGGRLTKAMPVAEVSRDRIGLLMTEGSDGLRDAA
jgi:general nucleoside transport system ATP-binding protein